MATPQPTLSVSGLASQLVAANLISERAARQAYQAATIQRKPFVQYLVDERVLDSRTIAVFASRTLGMPLLDLYALDPATFPVELVEEKLIRKHRALPIYQRGNHLFVAVSDPTNYQGLDEIRFNTGLATHPVLVEEDKLSPAIDKGLQGLEASMSEMVSGELGLNYIDGDDSGEGDAADLNVEDAPVVRFVNKVLVTAISREASDIHFEPYEKSFRIRLRIDGMLHEVAEPPVALAGRLAARLKVMSRMNIAERRVPQDGRIKLKLSASRDIDFRVNTLPTLYGEKVVLRLLERASAHVGIDKLGLDPVQKQAFANAIKEPYGMILATGPTGSGKTVTLYSALNVLNRPEVNISTVEDPVEILVPGINQVNMNPKTGLTFANALRAFLRQDPDIIMVGEVRDLETAEIAVKAAQTGHLVLSTLHTNDAPQTLTRLANMGLPAFNIASSVLLIMAQRLVRKLCDHCKEAEPLPKRVLLAEGFAEEDVETGFTVFRAVGCDRCTDGYRGRTGIFQVMPVSDAIAKLILEGGNALQLGEQARREGVLDLRQSGLVKVKAGITSLEELNRVTID